MKTGREWSFWQQVVFVVGANAAQSPQSGNPSRVVRFVGGRGRGPQAEIGPSRQIPAANPVVSMSGPQDICRLLGLQDIC